MDVKPENIMLTTYNNTLLLVVAAAVVAEEPSGQGREAENMMLAKYCGRVSQR